MSNLLETIENDYENLIEIEYVFTLDNNGIVSLEFKKENLPHLIGLHKLKGSVNEIRRMEDINDKGITPANIFQHLRNNNVDYNALKGCSHWDDHIKNRMENFSYENIHSILRQSTMFNFIYDPQKTKNDKAKYVLIDKKNGLFLQFYIGYDNGKDEYFPNSFVANNKKDHNLDRAPLRIVKTEIYRKNGSEMVNIETIEHKKIRDIKDRLDLNLTNYNRINDEMYKLAMRDEPYINVLNEVNTLSSKVKFDYSELINYVSPDVLLDNKSNQKLKHFLVNSKVIKKI